jgi:hypothetical protein
MGMSFTKPRPPRVAMAGCALAILGSMILSAGCASGGPAAKGASGGPAASGRPNDVRQLAAAYLAIAVPANHRLETEVDGFIEHQRDNLAVAESYLRAQAVTERWFDRNLMKIQFPRQIAADARALVRANQSRVALTELQARSTSIARLRSFTSLHHAADAAVEVQVKIIRRDLGLPPPSTS